MKTVAAPPHQLLPLSAILKPSVGILVVTVCSLISVLICISLLTNDFEQLYMCLLAFHASSSIFFPLLKQVMGSHYWVVKNCYIFTCASKFFVMHVRSLCVTGFIS